MKNLKPVIVQDASTKEVLMLAWANEEALKKTKETGYAWYFSRSRNKLWKKGETSGNVQKVLEILEDCDKDTLLYVVQQKGVACHTGKYSCFKEERPFTLEELEKVIEQRKREKPEESYTVKLLKDKTLLYEKLNEELNELIWAAKAEGNQRTIEETGDLVYHLLVLLAEKDINLNEVIDELKKRRTN